MDTTICPWCQTEIVWDEELGPEEECPYCHNELKGYRTLNIGIDSQDDEIDEEEDSPGSFWEEEGDGDHDVLSSPNLFGRDGRNPLVYESAVEKLLDMQEQVPECPHCREYMLYAGQKNMTQDGFEGFTPKGVEQPLLSNKVKLNVYVCSACFHVSEFLSEEDRIALIENVSGQAK